MAQTIVGIFDKASNAQDAVEALVKKGFDRSDIDMSAGSKGTDGNMDNDSDNKDHATGISGFFKNMFGSDDDTANRYDTYAAKSEAMVTVYANSADDAEKAADILDDNGAIDLNTEATESGSHTMMNKQDTMDKQPTVKSNDGDQKISIIEENLEVGKRNVQTGGMRLKSRIVEHPVEEQVRLREESVKVNRNAVNRPATDADFAAFKEGEIEMIESKEVPVVSKQARVVEEISLGKEVNERDETIRETVRKTEVDVEDMRKKITIDKSKN